jgi:fermentation-respiration switch protein FrsA (DUF1100 family)
MKRIPLIYLVGAIVCLAHMQAFGQFYYPDNREYQTPKQHGLKHESITFESKDGTKLNGWFVPATGRAIGTVVHFHGNAQNMTAHFSFVKWLPKQGLNLFVFDYRGYGKSEGLPTRTGVHEDGIAALQYIKTRNDIDQNKLFVLGQSLGGAVAISAIAGTNISGICGIVIESTFDSYTAIAKDKAPDILAALFISDTLSPISVVVDLSPTPMVFIHGTADKVVPYARGKRLFDQAKKPKSMWTIRGGRHTEAFTTYKATYRPRLIEFFKECLQRERHRTRN